MQEKYYSLREFAKKVGVSPQRLSELVKRGYIKTSASGMIPESEVEYFIREKLLKDLSHNPNSYLCIVFDKTSEELSEFKEYYDEKMKEGFSDIIEVSSITGLVKRLRIAVITNGASNDTTVLLYTRYQKELLKELVKGYKLPPSDVYVLVWLKRRQGKCLSFVPMSFSCMERYIPAMKRLLKSITRYFPKKELKAHRGINLTRFLQWRSLLNPLLLVLIFHWKPEDS